jgi:hypothetical protein
VREANAIEAVVGWLDAMRRGDLGAAGEWFHSHVTWRGVRDAVVCRNREDVLEMLGDSLTPCPEDPDSYELEPGLRGAEAVELLTPDPETVVLGAKVPGLSEVGGVPLRGQLFNVFRVRDGRIVEVADYARRDEALTAAGAQAPAWLTATMAPAKARSGVVDLVPFIHVSDVEQSIRFYAALGLKVVPLPLCAGSGRALQTDPRPWDPA